MAYFEAMESAVSDMLSGYREGAWVVGGILGDAPYDVLKTICDAAELADTSDQTMFEQALMDAGRAVIAEIHKYLSENYPCNWSDEGDIPDISSSCFSTDDDEKFADDARERFLDVLAESKRGRQ